MEYPFLSWFACNDIIGTFRDLIVLVLDEECSTGFPSVPCP